MQDSPRKKMEIETKSRKRAREEDVSPINHSIHNVKGKGKLIPYKSLTYHDLSMVAGKSAQSDLIRQPGTCSTEPDRPQLIQFDPRWLETGIKTWKLTLVGQFIGRPLSLCMVRRSIRPLWDFSSLSEVVQFSENLFGFMFDDSSDMIKIEVRGPWDLNGHLLLLQRWHPGIKPRSYKITTVPTWMSILDLPSEYFSEASISKIVENFGEVVKIDDRTKNLEIMAYARICVQISIDDPLPRGVNIQLPDGPHWVSFEFEHAAKICKKCSGFGHLFDECVGYNLQDDDDDDSHGGDSEVIVRDIKMYPRSVNDWETDEGQGTDEWH